MNIEKMNKLTSLTSSSKVDWVISVIGVCYAVYGYLTGSLNDIQVYIILAASLLNAACAYFKLSEKLKIYIMSKFISVKRT